MKIITITVTIDKGKAYFPEVEFSRKISKEEADELKNSLRFDLFCLYKKIKKHAKKTNKKKST